MKRAPHGQAMALYITSADVLAPSGNRPLHDAMIYKINEYIAGLVGKLWYLQHNCVGDTIVYH